MRKIILEKEVRQRVPFSSSTLRRAEDEGRFPRRVKFGAKRVGWFEDEVEAFLEKLAADRDGVKQPEAA